MQNSSYETAADQAARPGPVEKVIEGVVGKVLSNAGVRTVFGDPVREEGRTVIPVARVSYRFGFGAGEGPPGDHDDPSQGGGGGGGTLTARPVGFIETTNEGSRFVPAMDWSQILTTILTLGGIGGILAIWTIRPSRNDD